MADASYPDDLKYHPEHDWARIDGDTAAMGITWFAQDSLGEIVFFDPAVKMPAVVWPVISKFSIVIPLAPLLSNPRARVSPPSMTGRVWPTPRKVAPLSCCRMPAASPVPSRRRA